MKYYHPIPIQNLSIIQDKVFDLFPKTKYMISSLFYPQDNLEMFLNITELKEELDRLEWTNYVHSFAFFIVQKTNGSLLHTDTGDRTYSFNIPIKFCEKTKVNFYKTSNAQPIEQDNGIVTFNKYDSNDCELVDSLEMVTPHVINVKEVHNVTNPNFLPRITLLIRLKNTLDLSHLFL